MSQSAKPGSEAGSSGFFRSISAPAPSEKDNQQQDSASVEDLEPANEEESEEEFSEQETAEEESETEESEQEDSEQPDSDPDDPEKKRFKYWQSKHDKVTAELNKAKSELESLKATSKDAPPKEALEIAKAILEDANAVAVLEEYLKTGKNPLKAQSSGPSAREQLKTLQRPVEPVKPDDYNEDDAITDPKSASAQYLKAERKYEKDLQNFLLKREELRDKAEEEAESTRQQIERQQATDRQIRKDLTTKHGLNAGEVDEFFQVVNAQPTIDDMVLYFKAKKGLLKQAAQVTQKKQELDKKAELAKKYPPAPGTKTGGSAGQQKQKSFFGK